MSNREIVGSSNRVSASDCEINCLGKKEFAIEGIKLAYTGELD